MLDNILFDAQGIWVVIALFYILDNVKQLRSNRLVFRETWNFGWQPEVPSDTLVFLNKQIIFLKILLPHTMAIQLEWFTDEPHNSSRIRRADRFLRVARRKIFIFRCISTASFFAFFVEGPAITHWRGLTIGLVYILPFICAH